MVSARYGYGKDHQRDCYALELFPSGRILVMVPPLDLLVQTAQAVPAVGHTAPTAGGCSLQELRVRTTTHQILLALRASISSLVGEEGRGGLRRPLSGAGCAGSGGTLRARGRGDTPYGGQRRAAWSAIHDDA